MKRISIAIALSALVSSCSAPDSALDKEILAKVTTYHSAIKTLGGSLKSELKTAMKAGGPLNALDVCHTKADPISNKVSEQVGFSLKRTSLKPRNSNNAPDDWERAVLEKFEQRKAQGENPKTLEFVEVVENNGQRQVRYMKAISTGGACLKCHGSKVDPQVLSKIKELYPDDKAIGFQSGDLRGAFSITETLPK